MLPCCKDLLSRMMSAGQGSYPNNAGSANWLWTAIYSYADFCCDTDYYAVFADIYAEQDLCNGQVSVRPSVPSTDSSSQQVRCWARVVPAADIDRYSWYARSPRSAANVAASCWEPRLNRDLFLLFFLWWLAIKILGSDMHTTVLIAVHDTV